MVDFILTIVWFAALLCSTYVLMVNPAWLKKLHAPAGGYLRYYSRVIVAIVIAAIIYSLPQIRELLPAFGPEPPFALVGFIQSDGWAGPWAYLSRLENLTTIVVTITLAVSPMLRPNERYSWGDRDDLIVTFAANLLVAFFYPAVIGYHTAIASDLELGIWASLWAGTIVYLQWIFSSACIAIVLSGFTWVPKLAELFPDAWKIAKENPFSQIVVAIFVFVAVTVILVAGLSILAVTLFPISVAVKLVFDSGIGDFANSALVVVNMFIAATIGFLKIDEFLIAKLRCSLVAMILVVAIVLAWADLNDSHQIRELKNVDFVADRRNGELIKSFEKWKTNRNVDDESKPYPIYIVAAQGGGIYAAYHSAQFLAAAQDMTPAFVDHLFAISGVSGGALGAATFTSLIHQADASGRNGDEWFQTHTDLMLGQDFLTATVWTTLFTDPWSRIMPCLKSICPGRKLSRANTFEQTLEKAWQNAHPEIKEEDNIFIKSVYDQWNPEARIPALFLNTTEVETGENVVISSAGSLFGNSSSTIRWLSQRAPDLDIRLSTAVSLSARFPGLAPAGWYEIKSENDSDQIVKRRLVDGGYYDNSGVATAIAIIAALEPYKGNGHFILINLDSITESALAQSSAGGLGEILSPLKTLESTRSARARLAIEQAFVSLDGKICPRSQIALEETCVSEGNMRINTLATPTAVPLGWQLSAESRAAIRTSVGNANDCLRAVQTPDQSPPSQGKDNVKWLTRVENVRNHNSCLLATIRDELKLLQSPQL